MQTYWDLTESERSLLTKEEVERFLDAELMTKGVVKVNPPILEEVPPTPKVPTTTFYRVAWKDGDYSYSSFKSDFVFATMSDAELFLQSNPKRYKEPYRELARIETLAQPSIEPVECASEQDWLNNKSAIEKAKAVRSRNETAEAEFAKASKKQKEVLDQVWSDWAECRATRADHQRIVDTMASYTKTAGGDLKIAWEFLKKAFTAEEINAAYDWLGLTVECEEAEATA